MTRHVRAYIEQAPTCAGEELLLPEDEAVHLSRVLRIQAGAMIECLDGRGGCYTAECLEVNRARVSIRILTVHQSKHQTPELRIGVALGKGNKWEELIRPLTELGVHRLTPLISERTEGAFSPTKFEAKNIRWQKLLKKPVSSLVIFGFPCLTAQLPFPICSTKYNWMKIAGWAASTLVAPSSSPSLPAKKFHFLLGPRVGGPMRKNKRPKTVASLFLV